MGGNAGQSSVAGLLKCRFNLRRRVAYEVGEQQASERLAAQLVELIGVTLVETGDGSQPRQPVRVVKVSARAQTIAVHVSCDAGYEGQALRRVADAVDRIRALDTLEGPK